MSNDEPSRPSVGMDGSPAGIRTFSLNSEEAYAGLCGRGSYDPWIGTARCRASDACGSSR